jgi:hypothetical protein
VRFRLGRRERRDELTGDDTAAAATPGSPPVPRASPPPSGGSAAQVSSPAIESFKAASESIKAREAAERGRVSPPPAAQADPRA